MLDANQCARSVDSGNVAGRAGIDPGGEPDLMTETILDVRGLPAPEPLERVLAALATLMPGERLRLLIDIEPRPLYPMLERNGLGHRTEPGPDSGFAVTIWPREPEPARA
jgi:hypothetical protein